MEKVVVNQNPQSQMTQKVMQSVPVSRLSSKKKFIIPFVAGVIIIVGGAFSGWFLYNKSQTKNSTGGPTPVVNDNGAQGSSDMVADDSVFKDTAEGTLVEGGIEGEGTHHLDRGNGPEKYVYLTSSVIDLQSFVGKKVEVWGETLAGKEAGWLMDVGKIKVVE